MEQPVIYHSEESGLDKLRMSVCIWCEVSVSSSCACKYVTPVLIPYGKPTKLVKYQRVIGWLIDASAKIIKRDVARAAVARSILVLEHNQGMNPPHTTEGETSSVLWGKVSWSRLVTMRMVIAICDILLPAFCCGSFTNFSQHHGLLKARI